jgi:hypothetical protein
MVRLGGPDAPFKSWKVWERGAPELAIEVISDSDATDRPWEAKLDRYRRVGVRELVRFDPDEPAHVRIWDGVEGDLVERAPSDPGFWRSDVLGAFWCTKNDPVLGLVLRLARDPEGTDLFPTPDEARERADEARVRAEQRVRELEAELARRGK